MAPASCRRMRRWPRPARSSSAGRSTRWRGAERTAAVAGSCRRRRQPARLPRTVTSTFRAARSLPAGALEPRVPGEAMSRDDQIAIESPIQRLLERLHARHAGLRDGQVATYIPELAKADPDGSGSASRPPTARSTRSATRASRSPSSRSRSRSSTGSRCEDRGERGGARARSASSRPATRSTRSAWRRAPGARSTR